MGVLLQEITTILPETDQSKNQVQQTLLTSSCNCKDIKRYRTPKGNTIFVPVKIAEILQEGVKHLHTTRQKLVREYLSFTFSSANNLTPYHSVLSSCMTFIVITTTYKFPIQ